MIARNYLLTAILLPSLLFPFSASGYEQATHGFLTRRAYAASFLGETPGDGPSPLLASLGLSGYSPLGGLDRFFEFITTAFGTSVYQRASQIYEKKILTNLDANWASDPALAWMTFGSIREDDNPNEDPPTPQDIQPGIRRPLHHFFDPYFNRRLTAPGLDQLEIGIKRNPDWALGVKDSFTDPNNPAIPRINGFSVVDAREAMFRALTLFTPKDGGYVDIASGKDAATKQQWRSAYWATAFRALGDVLHLNQDMAQPQHTRNELHAGLGCVFGACLGGHTSVYEKYINARALKETSFLAPSESKELIRISLAPLAIPAYPIPKFGKYSDYWSTAPGPQSLQGKGLADYSNRGFFTAQNNLGATTYPSPPSDPLSYNVKLVTPLRWDGSPAPGTAPAYVFRGKVLDTLTDSQATDVPLTSFGVWDQFLTSSSNLPRYTLQRINYDAMANLLLPRAVAYSAGLINYFFRGRIDIALPDDGVYALVDHASGKGFKVLRAKLRNSTPAFADAVGAVQEQDMIGGQFFAVVRYHRDLAYKASLATVVGASPCTDTLAVVTAADPAATTKCRDGVEEIVVSRPIGSVNLPAGSEAVAEFRFTDTPIPLDAIDVTLQIVYRGPLGGESDSVAVGTIDVSEPTYFTYHNASDYVHLGDTVYDRETIDSDPSLLSLVQPQTCVDYRQSPARLRGECLTPFAIDLVVSFGTIEDPAVAVIGLPPRRFIRLAYLGDAGPSAGTSSKKMAAQRGRISVRRHGTSEKALLYQAGTCLPHDPFDIPPRHSQLTMLSGTTFKYSLDLMSSLRGVHGWYNASCVANGDLSPPGAVDNRARVMSQLDQTSAEADPYPATISPAYL